jgi:hypothetical protein
LIGAAQRVKADAEKQSEEQQTEYSEKDTALHLGLGLKRSDIRSSKIFGNVQSVV